jgi:Terminase RNaseH-like domain
MVAEPEQRHSRALEPDLIVDPQLKAEAEAKNGLRQYDLGPRVIETAIERGPEHFKLRPSTILSLQFTEAEIPETAKWNVGFDPGGFTHPAALVLGAYVPETDQFYVVDSQRLNTGEIHDHARAIVKLSRGLRVPIAWPHDAHKKQAASQGEELAELYRKREGLPMMANHVENPGGGYHVEPAIRDMVSYMNRPGGFIIASHLTELLEEMASYHLDEKHNIVRLRDDLVSACRYSFMGRYKGKILEMCEHYQRDFGAASASPMMYRPTMADRQRMNPQSRYAKGSINNEPYDLFTGKKFVK